MTVNSKTIKNIFISARPLQWMKNLALFAPLVFSGFLFFDPHDQYPYFLIVSWAYIIFCLLASSIYLLNDIIDVQADAAHPVKKNRPIASGELPISIALFASISGLCLVFLLSLSLSPFFQLLLLGYFLLQIAYSIKLKHLPILDVLAIASGFVLRIYAGAVVVNLGMNVWFLLTVVSVSLFLAVGKRQSERTLMKDYSETKTRATLSKYSQRLLDIYTSMFANATWLTYAIYTFQTGQVSVEPAFERFPLIYSILPRTFQSQKLLMLTVPLVIFGVMRYLALVYEENRGESPEKVLVNDKTLLTTVFVFIFMIIFIIYLE